MPGSARNPTGYRKPRQKTWKQIAKKVWPWALWIDGDGPFASVAPCGGVTVILYHTRERAEAANSSFCGSRCSSPPHTRHYVKELWRDE